MACLLFSVLCTLYAVYRVVLPYSIQSYRIKLCFRYIGHRDPFRANRTVEPPGWSGFLPLVITSKDRAGRIIVNN